MIYGEDKIELLYRKMTDEARRLLASLDVAEGRKPNTKVLNGWVYEQVIRYCLCEELKELRITPIIQEQVTLYGRAKVDLLVGNVAIEIKVLGSFGNDAKKYCYYRNRVEEKGWVYFYLTRRESYKPYRSSIETALGEEHVFFLDADGGWRRFIDEIIKELRKT
jgi:hypothetical protein